MKSSILLALLMLLPVQAQENSGRVTKLIEVKYADINKLNNLIRVFASKTMQFEIDRSAGVHYVSLAGPGAEVEAVERFIKQMDVPQPPERNIELTVYMLLGQHADGAEKLPSEIAGVAKQLQATFGMKDFRLLETSVARVRENNGTESNGLLSIPSPGPNAPSAMYTWKIQRCTISQDGKVRTIRLDNVKFGGRIPTPVNGGTQWQFLDIGINTDIDVKEGQKVVVGKTNIGAKDSLFFVVTAKVVE